MRQDREAIQAIRCFLLDMDGTIYLGDQLIEGTHAFLQAAKQSGRKVLFLTNNSSKNGETYLRKLSQMGIDAGPEDVLTSGQAAAQTIMQRYPGKKVWVMGNDLLKEELCSLGLPVVEREPDIVLTAFDTQLTYQKLWDCCDYVRQGLPYIATHPDFNCPTETGFMPDLGCDDGIDLRQHRAAAGSCDRQAGTRYFCLRQRTHRRAVIAVRHVRRQAVYRYCGRAKAGPFQYPGADG